ncbi:hypothetical protein L596_003397 [Steinernema carpocapsae]|uniref:Uncharacterized protein n=1 Tax=Steinernema carpocapsae TaxID=34508 RepID=A0A4U8UWF2_STECR|nr:hypothetical protein L596_003397 [Steinernema carpocapsae]
MREKCVCERLENRAWLFQFKPDYGRARCEQRLKKVKGGIIARGEKGKCGSLTLHATGHKTSRVVNNSYFWISSTKAARRFDRKDARRRRRREVGYLETATVFRKWKMLKSGESQEHRKKCCGLL